MNNFEKLYKEIAEKYESNPLVKFKRIMALHYF